MLIYSLYLASHYINTLLVFCYLVLEMWRRLVGDGKAFTSSFNCLIKDRQTDCKTFDRTFSKEIIRIKFTDFQHSWDKT